MMVSHITVSGVWRAENITPRRCNGIVLHTILIHVSEVCQNFLYGGTSGINFPSDTKSSPPSDCRIILRSGTTLPGMTDDMDSQRW